MKPTILVVDDEDGVLDSYRSIFNLSAARFEAVMRERYPD